MSKRYNQRIETSIYRAASGFRVYFSDGNGRRSERIFDTIEGARRARDAHRLAVKEIRSLKVKDSAAKWRLNQRMKKAGVHSEEEYERLKQTRKQKRLEATREKHAKKSEADEIKELIRISRRPWYDPDTGFIYRLGKRIDRQGKGKKERYRFISTEGKRRVPAHRFAVFYMTGSWPIGPVDHINGVGDDNRWLNLREVTVAENNANVPVPHSRKVVRVNGLYYPILTRGFTCPHEATLIAEAMGGILKT